MVSKEVFRKGCHIRRREDKFWPELRN